MPCTSNMWHVWDSTMPYTRLSQRTTRTFSRRAEGRSQSCEYTQDMEHQLGPLTWSTSLAPSHWLIRHPSRRLIRQLIRWPPNPPLPVRTRLPPPLWLAGPLVLLRDRAPCRVTGQAQHGSQGRLSMAIALLRDEGRVVSEGGLGNCL